MHLQPPLNSFFQKIKAHWEVTLIFLAGLAMRIYMARIDPYLHEWDERYHALVAKNMMTHPFKPMLIVNPVTIYDPSSWCCNIISGCTSNLYSCGRWHCL